MHTHILLVLSREKVIQEGCILRRVFLFSSCFFLLGAVVLVFVVVVGVPVVVVAVAVPVVVVVVFPVVMVVVVLVVTVSSIYLFLLWSFCFLFILLVFLVSSSFFLFLVASSLYLHPCSCCLLRVRSYHYFSDPPPCFGMRSADVGRLYKVGFSCFQHLRFDLLRYA